MNNPGYTFVDVTEPVIYVAISANDILLQDEKSSYKRFPFVPFVGYLDAAEEDWEYRLKGYANQLIGIQDQILFFRGAILKSVRDYSQQVIMVEDGALKNDDVSELVKVKSRSGVLRTKKGGNAGISWKEQSPIPQAYQGMELTLRNDLNVVGTPPEVMGTTGNLESGRAIGLMQSVGLVHTGEINEHLNFALRLLGQIILEIAFENFTQGKFQRICGKGFEILPQSLDLAKRFLSYDIKIDETTNSPTYRKAAFEEIIQAAQYIPGFSLPPEIVTEAMSLPYDIKQQFKEWQIKQQQMMMQQQQAQAMGAIQSNAALQPGAM
jgi:hypothetical protein